MCSFSQFLLGTGLQVPKIRTHKIRSLKSGVFIQKLFERLQRRAVLFAVERHDGQLTGNLPSFGIVVGQLEGGEPDFLGPIPIP